MVGALDASDPATGAARPVLVMVDSGGAAKDIHDYCKYGAPPRRPGRAAAAPAPRVVVRPPLSHTPSPSCAPTRTAPPHPNARRADGKLPTVGEGGRTAEYVRQAAHLLPAIMHPRWVEACIHPA